MRLAIPCLALLAFVAASLAEGAAAQTPCRTGFVWREAFPGDFVCVPPRTRAETDRENREAAARREPGAYGPNTCKTGYVWREARPDDVVCVTPEVRARAAADNASAAARAVAPAAGVATPRPSEAVRSAAVSSYRSSEWSAWKRVEGLEFQYRWGWDPEDSQFGRIVDATFAIRNRTSRSWEGAPYTLECTGGSRFVGPHVVLQPNETREVKFRAPNCGSLQAPWFDAGILKTVRFD